MHAALSCMHCMHAACMHAAGIPLNKRDSRKADSVSLKADGRQPADSQADAVSLSVRLTRQPCVPAFKSDDILDGDLDDVLKARRADGAFWSHFQQHNLPVRVQQILNEIGFYGVYRCGRLVYDCHLITALVERWRSETHTFHFRVGEATITLQDVQIIWALPIDGEPVTGLDLDRTTIEWQDYCLTYLGFRPDATAFKGSRLQTHAIISHIAQVEITYDTPHEIVVQYARAVALLLLGGIWAWSRIIPLCPGLGAERVYMGQVQTDNNRLLPAAPYGATWNCEHTFTRTVRTTVRVIRDILDEMQSDQPYDLDSDVIMAYAADFNPQLWRSSCPLIFYAIVEMHHPERVLRQFGMRQNIPEAIDTRDMSLHQISRKNRTGTDWNLQHIQYISRWQRRYDTVVQRPPISNRRDTERGYWEWYNNITRHFVSSSTNRRVESGYQPGNAPMLQVVTDEVHALDAICQSTHLPLTNEECRQLVDRFAHGIQIIKEALPHLSQQIATSSDNAPTTSHRQRRSSSRMSIGSVERDDVGVDLAGPSTVYTPQDYYVPQPPQDDYVPQPPQDDCFKRLHICQVMHKYILISALVLINHMHQNIIFHQFHFHHLVHIDNVESSSAASSSPHSNSGGDNNDEQNEPIDDMGEQIRRPRRQRHRRNCGTGGHF
ncbi:UNVERIFIED_CONTAM: Serine/threonine-protein phosphatase 7 long form [Sesamum radiatum]|uniref:Serine/threonine-protein phosphatase 7 long form n=1 Tax=Sesamum radiatum TaxID=300843 RepID=A0AAW2NQR8_SESRA